MRIPTRDRRHGLSFNITPLIDIVFLLIIFFLAASHLARSEAQTPINLPVATQTQDENQPPRRIVVTVTADGAMQVGPRTVDLAEIEQMLLARQLDGAEPDLAVHIRADRSVPYRDIEPIMLACARAGITEIGFAVLPR